MVKKFGILNARYLDVETCENVTVQVPKLGTSFFRPIEKHKTKDGRTVPEHWLLGVLDRKSGNFLTIHYYVGLKEIGRSVNCRVEVRYKVDTENPDRKDLLIDLFPVEGKSKWVLDVNPKNSQYTVPGPARLGISIIPLRN